MGAQGARHFTTAVFGPRSVSGVVGAVAKPLAGVAGGVSEIASGISGTANTIAGEVKAERVCIPRQISQGRLLPREAADA